jgi:hypothetical protein
MKYISLASTIGMTAAAIFLNNCNANAVTFIGYDANTSTSTNPPPLLTANSPFSLAAFDSFSAQLNDSVVTTESFENIPTATAIDGLATTISGTNANFSYKKKTDGTPANGNIQQKNAITGLTNAGTYPTDGNRGISINSANTFSISFTNTLKSSTLLAAFGYYGTDLGDNNNILTMKFYNGTDLVQTSILDPIVIDPTGHAGNSSIYFFGFIADSSAQYFDKVDFVSSINNVSTSPSDAIGIDQIKVATPAQRSTTQAPEPATIIGTLIGAGYISRMKRRQQLAKSSNK